MSDLSKIVENISNTSNIQKVYVSNFTKLTTCIKKDATNFEKVTLRRNLCVELITAKNVEVSFDAFLQIDVPNVEFHDMGKINDIFASSEPLLVRKLPSDDESHIYLDFEKATEIDYSEVNHLMTDNVTPMKFYQSELEQIIIRDINEHKELGIYQAILEAFRTSFTK